MIAKAYYGSKISPNRTQTPEGYLILLNCPIARTGWYEYLPGELGLDSHQGETPIPVYRSEAEVFSPASVASFEGKPLTNEHPPQWLDPSNVNSFMKGVVTNVRRGSGEESDLLLGDIIVYDPALISQIESGKRELSSGYDYECTPHPTEEGKFIQQCIRGNHVAAVTAGRAGSRVAAKDEKPEGGKKGMKLDRTTLFGKMFKAFARDAEPEELAEASKMINGDQAAPAPTPVAPQVPPTTGGYDQEEPHDEESEELFFKELLAAIRSLKMDVEALKKEHATMKAAPPAPATDALEDLEQEMTGGDAEPNPNPNKAEESVTIDPEALATDEAPVACPEDRPKNPIPGADSKAAIMAAIKAVKPIIAAIPDANQRRQASDALAKTFRSQLVTATPKATSYAQLAKTTRGADAQVQDQSKIGEDLKFSRNPHYKNKKNG